MSSESQKIIQEYERSNPKKEAMINAEDNIIQQGILMDDFMHHPGWKKLSDELSAYKQQLVNELVSPSVCDNLSKIKTRQHLIQAIDLFVQTPKKFVLNKSNILNRRSQCRKP